MNKHFTILHIKNGEVANKSAVKKLFDELQDGKYLIEIARFNKRSLQQNAYLHGVLIPEFKNALISVGYNAVKTNEQAKRVMKSMFLPGEIVNEKTGEIIPYTKDTSDLTTTEMATLIEEVIQFAAQELGGYQIPYPNEQLAMYD